MKTKKNNLEYGFTLIEVIIIFVVAAVVAAMMASYFGTWFTKSSLPISRMTAAENLNQIVEKITADYNNAPATWSPSTAYTASTSPAAPTVVLPTEANRNGYRYICTAGGTSGTTEPAWPTIAGATVTDGTVIWKYANIQPPMNWQPNIAYPLNAVVYPTNGLQYICTVAGISGTTAPTWPTSGAVTETTGSTPKVQWTYRGSQPTVALQAKIGAEGNDYTQTFSGVSISYRVIQNRFITFDTTNTENDTCTQSSCNMLISGVTTNVYGKYLKVTIGLPMSMSNRTAETLTTLFVRR